ncbi:hypothetical protein, partial [Desmospora profundinema]|uniref:hypothetical protein n=1 Tax=Desmospora profundinema TaxID=1571184 RepID=UPI00286D19C5
NASVVRLSACATLLRRQDLSYQIPAILSTTFFCAAEPFVVRVAATDINLTRAGFIVKGFFKPIYISPECLDYACWRNRSDWQSGCWVRSAAHS